MKVHENDIRVKGNSSEKEIDFRKEFFKQFKDCPIPEDEGEFNSEVRHFPYAA